MDAHRIKASYNATITNKIVPQLKKNCYEAKIYKIIFAMYNNISGILMI